MAQYYLVNTTIVGGAKFLAGDLIDDAVTNTAAITAAGGLLWPSSEPIVAAAAARAQSLHKNRGVNEADLNEIMTAAVDAVQKAIDVPAGTGFRKIVAGVEQAAAEPANLSDATEVAVPGVDGDQLIRSGGVVAGARRPVIYNDAVPANYSNVTLNVLDLPPFNNAKIGIVNFGHDDQTVGSNGLQGNYAVCVGGNMPSITADYAGGGGYRPNAHGLGAWAFGYSAFADGEACFAGGRSVVAGWLVNMMGAPNLTFTNVGAANDTITRSAGSWIADQFTPGMFITVTGSISNNVTDALVIGVTALVLTLDTTPLTNEGPVAGCSVVGKTKGATAFGIQTQARAWGSFGAGGGGVVDSSAWYGVVFGFNSAVGPNALYGIAMGNQCNANAYGAVALGTSCTVTNNNGVAIGIANTVGGEGGVALGRQNVLNGAADFAFAAGYNNSVSARGAVALGEGHSVGSFRAFVHGYNVTSSRVAEYAHGAFTSGDGPAGVFRRNLLLGTSVNGATVNLLNQLGTEFALENNRSYLIRVFVLGGRTDAGGRGAVVHTILAHTVGGAVTIDNDTPDYAQLGLWTVVVSAPGGLVLRVACTGSVGETVKFSARVEMTELEGV